MNVLLGFVHLSLSKLTVYIAQYGLQTTEFWLSRDFGTTGNIPKKPEVSVKKAFFSCRLSVQEAASSCTHYIRSVGSCWAVSLCILALLQTAPAPSLQLKEENPTHENGQGEAPSDCPWLHTKILHSLKSCSHSRPVQMWCWKPKSGLANHGLERASSF